MTPRRACEQEGMAVERVERAWSRAVGDVLAGWRWYRAMAGTWLAIRPRRRRTLVLETHRWLAARLAGGDGGGLALAAADLEEDGDLARRLAACVPVAEAERWRPWIRLVLHDLRRALAQRGARRDETWERWLFLIPYSVPAPRRRGAGAGRVGAA